ncbi:Uncharacterized protein HZ326_3082 [Fusarium oxysporum f. sp. albedinis]|nr:Uncharacterized protein HZ326_3082 [Fusarium oxysporum f. sp. albedinis]
MEVRKGKILHRGGGLVAVTSSQRPSRWKPILARSYLAAGGTRRGTLRRARNLSLTIGRGPMMTCKIATLSPSGIAGINFVIGDDDGHIRPEWPAGPVRYCYIM